MMIDNQFRLLAHAVCLRLWVPRNENAVRAHTYLPGNCLCNEPNPKRIPLVYTRFSVHGSRQVAQETESKRLQECVHCLFEGDFMKCVIKQIKQSNNDQLLGNSTFCFGTIYCPVEWECAWKDKKKAIELGGVNRARKEIARKSSMVRCWEQPQFIKYEQIQCGIPKNADHHDDAW